MKPKLRKKVIHCPVKDREAEVTYRISGTWLDREYDIVSCPAMRDGSGCDRQCQHLLGVGRTASDWQMHS